MIVYAARRIVYLAATLAVVAVGVFLLTSVLPNDAAQSRLGIQATTENLAALRAQLGLDRPIGERLLAWLGRLATGDLGESLSFRQPIGDLIASRLANSALLAGSALVVGVPLAIGLGLWAGLRRNRWPDRLISTSTLVAFAVPDFVWAVLLILVFSTWLGWVPALNLQGATPLAHPESLILPVVTVLLITSAQVLRMMRSATIGTMRQDFIRTARLKGSRESKVICRHALRNAVGPAVSMAGIQVGYMFGSLAVVETVFNYQGIGSLVVFAVTHRDVPLLAASVLVIAAIACAGILVADLVVVALDPRLRRLA